MKEDHHHRSDIVEIGRRVHQNGWVAANDGNISVRLDEYRILVTPTGVSKGMMSPESLAVCDLKGKRLQGELDQTSEIEMHLTIYRLRPDVSSVLHAHPPVATGFAVAGRSLDSALLPEVVVNLGTVPLAGYGLPGTDALIQPMLPYIPDYDAILMANHGVVSSGEDVYQAFFRMETVEHSARVALVAELLGGARALPEAEVEKLIAFRARSGVETKGGST